MFVTKLQVVNACLGTLGELPLNELDLDHPYVPAILDVLDVVNVREQSKGWWFNQETLTLTPQSDTGFILLGNDFLSVDPVSDHQDYVQRGNRLYKRKPAQGEDPFVFTAPVTVEIKRLLPFEDLPSQAAVYVRAATVMDFQADYDADQNKVAYWTKVEAKALITLNAEHTRNLDVNLLETEAVLLKRLHGRPYPGAWRL